MGCQYARRHGITDRSIFVTRNGRPLSRHNIRAEMKTLCTRAGVDRRKVFPHNLRHLFAKCVYAAEKDLGKLADVLGHSNINTTRIAFDGLSYSIISLVGSDDADYYYVFTAWKDEAGAYYYQTYRGYVLECIYAAYGDQAPTALSGTSFSMPDGTAMVTAQATIRQWYSRRLCVPWRRHI